MRGANGAAGVRFVRIELDYGRHSTAFDLGTDRAPFVIEGPNGSGKSSLMEALGVGHRTVPGAGHWAAYECATGFERTLLGILREPGAPPG